MLKPEPHQLHPAPPFKYPPDSTHLMEWFPIGFDAGQLNTETLLDPEEFRPELSARSRTALPLESVVEPAGNRQGREDHGENEVCRRH